MCARVYEGGGEEFEVIGFGWVLTVLKGEFEETQSQGLITGPRKCTMCPSGQKEAPTCIDPSMPFWHAKAPAPSRRQGSKRRQRKSPRHRRDDSSGGSSGEN